MVFRRNTRVSGNTVGKMSSWDSFASLWTPAALKTAPDPPTVLSPKAFNDNTVWIRSSDVTRITADAVANPVDATVDADNFFFSTATTDKLQLTQYNLDFVEGFEYTFSVYAKGNPDLVANKFLQLSFGTTCFDEDWAVFDVFNGDLVEEFGGSSPSHRSNVTDVGGGWYKLEFSLVAKATGTDDIAINIAGSNVYRVTTFIGSSDGYYLWNAQITCSSVLSNWVDANTLSEGNVTGWEDQSANEWDFTTPSATKPQLVTDGFNGLPTVRFNGSSTYMTCNSLAAISTGVDTSLSIFTAIKTYAQNAIVHPLQFTKLSATEPLFLIFAQDASNLLNSTKRVSSTGGDLYTITGTSVAGTNTVLSHVHNGTYSWLYSDDNVNVEGALNTAGNITCDGFQFGALQRTTVSNYAQVDISENLAFRTGLPDDIRKKLTGYLAHKWGTSSNLPVGHPYKTQPPYLS